MKDMTTVFKTEFWQRLNDQMGQDDLRANRGSLGLKAKKISKSDIRSIFTATINDFLLYTTEDKLCLCGKSIYRDSPEEDIMQLFEEIYPDIESYLIDEKQVTIINPDNI